MNTDFPERLHQSVYGKTDKVNAVENDSADFQAGFDAGMNPEPSDQADLIAAEYERRGSPAATSLEIVYFREWKRGLWAARMQRLWAGITTPK